MSNDTTFPKTYKKLLIITSSGGGGLLQTANAKAQEAMVKNPGVEIVRIDLLQDWLWRPMGKYFINFWNKAQMKGDVTAQMICVYGQFFVDIFLHPTIFFYALYTLFKEDVDHIIDTQPLGTSAIIKAIRIFNRKRNKDVRLEKVLVDLPTRKATHFFRPIKKLSKAKRKLLQLTSIEPLLEEGETAEEFWQSTCGLSAKEINLEDVYVRQAFNAYKNIERPSAPMQLNIRYKGQDELKLMQKAFSRGSIKTKIHDDGILFKIAPTDKVITILLGSQPAKEATLNYVKKAMAFAKSCPKATTHLFVFCADHVPGTDSLFKKVADFTARIKNYPKKISVIPFSFQDEDVIAPLFFRSDITCTRSGGQTAMELMCVGTGEIWIHSEAKKGQDLLSGIPGWESASAVYLKKVKGAKIVTPETFATHAKSVYQTNSEPALPLYSLQSSA